MKQKLFKNKLAVTTGLITGLLSALLISELFQVLTGLLFGSADIGFVFDRITFRANISFASEQAFVGKIFVSISSVIFIIVVLEIGAFMLKKTQLGFWRYTLILFLLINIGGLIIFTFYDALLVILRSKIPTDFALLIQVCGFGYNESIVFMFFIILILIAYLNFSTVRVIKYINY